MNRYRLITTSFLAVVLLAAGLPAGADQQRSFGFTGEVNTFNRGSGTLVVEDLVFRISESTSVHKKRGAKGTLSDITPGTKLGFYPGSGDSPLLSDVWVLPKNWKAEPGYAASPEN
jgi:hypothetical protein